MPDAGGRTVRLTGSWLEFGLVHALTSLALAAAQLLALSQLAAAGLAWASWLVAVVTAWPAVGLCILFYFLTNSCGSRGILLLSYSPSCPPGLCP